MRVIGNKKFVDVVDYKFGHGIWSVGSLCDLGKGFAGFDVAIESLFETLVVTESLFEEVLKAVVVLKHLYY